MLVELGGYDEGFIRREDAELGFRLAERGLPFRYVERAAVEHHSSFGPAQHIRRSYWNGYYLAMLLMRTQPSVPTRISRCTGRGSVWPQHSPPHRSSCSAHSSTR